MEALQVEQIAGRFDWAHRIVRRACGFAESHLSVFPATFRIVRMEVDYFADVVDCADERLELLLFHEDCVPSFAFDSEAADRGFRGRTEFRDGEVLQALIFETLKRVKNN